jgi:hypothetical protein
MSDVIVRFRGRLITRSDVDFVRTLIAENPQLNRNRISVRVAQHWGWVQANGHLKDMLCRTLLLLLHRAGHIQLPPPRRRAVNNVIRHRAVRDVAPIDATPIAQPLRSLRPLQIRPVRRAEGEDLFAALLQRHHYLGYSRPVGEHLKYLVLAGERPLACLAWNSAPLRLDLRDQFVGADKSTYRHNLDKIVYNSRFLIVPWARVPGLASHVLAQIAGRISSDWQALYAHPVHLLESFVDTERFHGTCYRAANWVCRGRTEGRGTKSKSGDRASIKEYWVYPLAQNFRENLLAP